MDVSHFYNGALLQKGLDNVVPGQAAHEGTSKLTRDDLVTNPPHSTPQCRGPSGHRFTAFLLETRMALNNDFTPWFQKGCYMSLKQWLCSVAQQS